MNLRTLGARCVSLCALLLVVMAGWPLASTAQNTYALPMVLPASNAALAGFVRIINLSARAGTVSITAVDSDGESYGPVTLSLDAHEAVNFNSRDLEQGNAAKGLPSGVGDGSGSWRLSLETALNVTPLAYIRTSDGFVTGMHDVAPETAPGSRRYRVVFFNPGSNTRQVSSLRLINPGSAAADVEITARDDAGDPAPGGAVRVTLAPWSSRTLTAQALEAGTGLDGRLGDGAGKWRLTVSSNVDIQVISLLRSPTGHLANLSTAPDRVLAAACPEVSEFGRPGSVMTLRDTNDGTVEVVRFLAGGRFINENPDPRASFTYRKSAADMARVEFHDSEGTCSFDLVCTTQTSGTYRGGCTDEAITGEPPSVGMWTFEPPGAS